jgi:hypothetical protein
MEVMELNCLYLILYFFLFTLNIGDIVPSAPYLRVNRGCFGAVPPPSVPFKCDVCNNRRMYIIDGGNHEQRNCHTKNNRE